MILPMIAAMLLSLLLVLLSGPRVIRKLKELHFGTVIYELGPAHQQKQGTPLMGGLMMALGITAATLLCHPLPWGGWQDPAVPLLLAALLSLAVGLADDWIKAVKKRHEGLTPWQKIAGQVVTSAAFSIYCYMHPLIGSRVIIPFVQAEWDLGFFYIPLLTLTMIFFVNSSNLQDGLDGLLSSVTVISSAGWALTAAVGTALLGWNRTITGPTAVMAMSVTGACIGFLRFNRFPARTFMGDTGSMLLGGSCVGIAMVLRQPFLLILFGFCPIMSSISVILQRYYYKLTHGKRIFLMSPVHHHFEKKGYSETQIVSMYSGITMILSLIAVLSLFAGIL